MDFGTSDNSMDDVLDWNILRGVDVNLVVK